MDIKILFFGDVVGKIGRRAIAKVLPELKKKYKPDLTIANAENLAHGSGVTRKTLNQMIGAGIDFFTSGNHIWDKPVVNEIFAENKIPLIRPANYSKQNPGEGYKTLVVGEKKIIVLNLLGKTFIKEKKRISCPFKTAGKILKKIKSEKSDAIIIDFHAETTSEKKALGFYLDGKVSAIVGTHTHIPTADNQILGKGTAYVTDIGMVGAKDSVIGVDKDIIINNFVNKEKHLPFQFPEKGICIINSVLIKIDPKNKKAKKIERIDLQTKI